MTVLTVRVRVGLIVICNSIGWQMWEKLFECDQWQGRTQLLNRPLSLRHFYVWAHVVCPFSPSIFGRYMQPQHWPPNWKEAKFCFLSETSFKNLLGQILTELSAINQWHLTQQIVTCIVVTHLVINRARCCLTLSAFFSLLILSL